MATKIGKCKECGLSYVKCPWCQCQYCPDHWRDCPRCREIDRIAGLRREAGMKQVST